MSKVLIIFGSTTGNTESIASKIGTLLEGAGVTAEVKNAADISDATDIAKDYDAVLMGASCWGDEDIELQDDFQPVFDQLKEEKIGSMGLSGKKVAAFASGDSSYQHFCGAVDVIEEAAKDAGATIVAGGLKVEGDASAAPGEIEEFATAVAKSL